MDECKPLPHLLQPVREAVDAVAELPAAGTSKANTARRVIQRTIEPSFLTLNGIL